MAKKQNKIAKKRRIILIVSISLIVLALILLIVGLRAKNTGAKKVQASEYRVREESFENIIEITGNVLAAASQDLTIAGSGTVTKVYVQKGDVVKKGQVIIELDASEQEYALAKHDYDTEQKRINGSRREIELMEKQRDVLLKKLEDRKILAYFDGIIAQFSVAEGDYLEAKDSVGVIIDRSYMKAMVEVVETDAQKLKLNQKVYFTFPAYANKTIEGYVVAYPSVGRITNRGATVVDAELRIDNPPADILPNYSFTGKIEVAAPVTMRIVEREAIGRKEGKSFVEKIQPDGSLVKSEVEVQAYGVNFVEVLSGAQAGDLLKSQSTGISGSLRLNSANTSTTINRTTGGGQGMSGGAVPMMRP